MTVMIQSIPVERTEKSRIRETDFNNLEFGKYISDHMLISAYKNGQWQEMKIVPFGEIPMTPAMLSLHYGQTVFEGLKAFRNNNGDLSVFRMAKHSARLNKSLERMCMPSVSEEMFSQGIHALLEVDQQWVPTSEGASLYIRPLVFATESRFGVKISDDYLFVIMTSPVGPYFSKPLRLKIEDTFVRAAEGGPGYAKCAGNYGGAFYPTQLAREQGFDQVLWTDAREHKYIDEAGVMNVMFVINGRLITPKLSSSILDGVTRDSILQLAPTLDMETEDRKVSVEEVVKAIEDGSLTEAFGAGTAAVVSPIATITVKGVDYHLPEPDSESFQQRVKQKLNNIRMGAEPDPFGWNYIIPGK
ncbi:MAG TPA: branched-chain amino acid aminotransferase [Cyclobacteriaceae bacterium]|nr:branched-chain amino acid aminotransferase [Cyclobacteriaceae bacterium]